MGVGRRSNAGTGDTAAKPPGGRWKRRAWRGAAWVAAAYAMWLLLAFFLQRRLVFPRHIPRQDPAAGAGLPGLQKRWISTSEGRVETWFVPAANATTARPAPAVIIAHGNAELIDGQGAAVHGYHRLGISALLCEFRGYGRSAGSPSQGHIVADHVRCYDWLAKRGDVDRRRIVFHGRSLGTGVVTALAVKRKPAALVLVSPFTSLADVMAWYLIPRFLVRDPFDNEAALERLDRPVLLVHGTNDRVVPYRHSRSLHRIAKRSTLSTYSCGHNDVPIHSKRFWQDIATHLHRAGVIR
ncbi:MAG: alpha/beta hydrolase [bacterium]